MKKKASIKRVPRTVQYWILPVYGGTDPFVPIGPYKTRKSMVRRARRVYHAQDHSDSLFYLVTGLNLDKPGFYSFTNVEMELR